MASRRQRSRKASVSLPKNEWPRGVGSAKAVAAMDHGLSWLLASADPAVRNLARTDLLDGPFDPNAPLQSPRVLALLAAPIRGHPYGNKWKGAHWRLVSLVELGVTLAPEVAALVDQVLSWIAGPRPRVVVAGRERRHASMEGNALAVCSRLGLAADPRVKLIKDTVLQSQWPDGGWNCDRRPRAVHSSFHETLATLWGLIEYTHATANPETAAAAGRAANFFSQASPVPVGAHRPDRRRRMAEAALSTLLALRRPAGTPHPFSPRCHR